MKFNNLKDLILYQNTNKTIEVLYDDEFFTKY